MSLIDTLIKKVEELTRAVSSIRSSSKKIHDLPEISGEDIYVAASNGVETGKVLLQPQNYNPPPTISNSWEDVELLPSSNFNFNASSTCFNFSVNRNSWGVTIPSIKGFSAGEPTDGLDGFLRNGGNELIIIRHNSINIPGVTIPFFLSNGADYSLKPNEILSFKYSTKRNRCELSVYDFSAITPLKPNSEFFRISQEHLDAESVFIELKEIPSENEFLFVFCNGLLLNSAGISAAENILIIDKKAVEYEFRVGMKITVNYKY